MAAPKLRYSFREYLQVDLDSPVRHEFLDGMILAMAGGTPDHAALAAAVTASLNRQLTGKRCRVYSEALRIRALATGFAGYADVTVICAKLELDPEDRNTATNPSVLVEILSPSTQHYDRGEKLRNYQQISTVSHVVLVAHDSKCIEVWTRTPGEWRLSRSGAGEQAELGDIGCVLDVDSIYHDPLGD